MEWAQFDWNIAKDVCEVILGYAAIFDQDKLELDAFSWVKYSWIDFEVI